MELQDNGIMSHKNCIFVKLHFFKCMKIALNHSNHLSSMFLKLNVSHARYL